jgi:hypothetical protein
MLQSLGAQPASRPARLLLCTWHFPEDQPPQVTYVSRSSRTASVAVRALRRGWAPPLPALWPMGAWALDGAANGGCSVEGRGLRRPALSLTPPQEPGWTLTCLGSRPLLTAPRCPPDCYFKGSLSSCCSPRETWPTVSSFVGVFLWHKKRFFTCWVWYIRNHSFVQGYREVGVSILHH